MSTATEALAAAATEAHRTLRLTPRWTALKPHAIQQAYFWHPARFRLNPSGRRSGKTELAKRKGVLELCRQRPWPSKILYFAPTHGQVKDIYWQDLQDLVPRHWVAQRQSHRSRDRHPLGSTDPADGLRSAAAHGGRPLGLGIRRRDRGLPAWLLRPQHPASAGNARARRALRSHRRA